jgi:hypothetical protein
MNVLEQAFHFAIGYLVPLVEACGAWVVVMGVERAICRDLPYIPRLCTQF